MTSNHGISGSRIEDVMPAAATVPVLAVSNGDSGIVEAGQTLRHDDLTWQESPQKIVPQRSGLGTADIYGGILP